VVLTNLQKSFWRIAKGNPADLNRRGSTARQRERKPGSAEHSFNSRRAAFVPVRAVLAADRNILASEHTYAAWVRTGLLALAGTSARGR
jgi:uncharacterized membrane protein YidH (DUF202 family)